MTKHAQQSLIDMLFQVMPELRGKLTIPGTAKTSNEAAKSLYSIWQQETRLLADNKFKKPETLGRSEQRMLEQEGLILSSGDSLTITKKGSEVLKQMILGDDRSIFQQDGKPIDYYKAAEATAPKTKKAKTASRQVMTRVTPLNWYKASES